MKDIFMNRIFKLSSVIAFLLIQPTFIIAQNPTEELYTARLEVFLTDSFHLNRYNINEEHIKYGNIIIAMNDFQNNMPKKINGLNLIYKEKIDICNYLNKEKYNRLVLYVTSLRLDNSDNTLFINILPYFVENNKNNCNWKIFAGGSFIETKKMPVLKFNCLEGIWEVK
jgi:hypothetical protein